MAFVAQDSLLGTVDLTLEDIYGPGPFTLTSTSNKYGRFNYPSQFIEAVDTNLGGGVFVFAQANSVAAQTISSITIGGSTATLTTGSAHSLSIGSIVKFAAVTPSAYNGRWVVATTPSTTTATLTPLAGEGAATSPPTASATVVGTYTTGIGASQVVQFNNSIDANGVVQLQTQVWIGTANTALPLGVAYAPSIMLGAWGWFQISGVASVFSAGTPAAGISTYWAVGTTNSLGGALTSATVASKQVNGAQFASAAGATYGSGNNAVTLPSTKALVWLQSPTSQGAIT